MANKSLTDLTARTATADSDLLHINSGGTDYKQAKSDFTKDIVTKITFNNTSLLTSQCEALANQNYTGYISSAGHVTETGVPEDTYYWVFVYKLGANNIRVEIRELAPAGHTYHNTKTTQGWSGWILDPTREEITSINTNKQDSLSWTLAYSGSIPKSSSYTFTSDSNHLYFIVYGTWNYKGVFFVNTQNGNTPQIFEVFHTAMCSVSASGTWGFTINNLNTNYNLPVYIFQFL